MTTRRSRKLLASLTLLSGLWLAACGGSSSSSPTLSSITVAPTTIPLAPGGTQQLAVTAHYSDASTATVTSAATYQTSAAAAATVSASGLVTAVAAGNATITATYSGKTADAAVTVTAAAASGLVFADAYPAGVTYAPFGGSTGAPVVDSAEHHTGTASLRVDVPAAGYVGGAFVASAPQDLSSFNAVTFWAKASKAAALNVAGLGNDSAAAAFSAEVTAIPLTTTWTKFIIPIPVPAKFTAASGLFHLAEGAEEGAYSIWIDDVQYENLPGATLAAPTAAAIGWPAVNLAVAGTQQLVAGPNTVTYAVPALTLTNVAFHWFDLTSSAPAVATVGADGLVTGVASGSASLTATLGALTVPGSAAVTVASTAAAPTAAPAAPTAVAADVISLLSKAYTNVGVDTWGTTWSNGGAGPNLTETTIGGDPMKKYSALSFIGVEFTGANLINATTMTHFHLDVWTPDATVFKVKLVDFGANAAFAGGDDTEAELTFNATSSPALVTGQWISLDLPLSSFGALASRAHLAQLVLSSSTATVFVDNVYFHKSNVVVPTAPTTIAPTPTAAAANVISLFSSVYTNHGIDTWRTGWSPGGAVLTDPYTIAGTPSHDVKKYAFADASNNYVGIEFTGANLVDATTMTHFHVDLWTPDMTNFQVKLVDFGADAAFAGGDDTDAIYTITGGSTPALATGQWLSYDLPLADFAKSQATWNRAHLAQLLFVSGAGTGTVFIDNLYFHK